MVLPNSHVPWLISERAEERDTVVDSRSSTLARATGVPVPVPYASPIVPLTMTASMNAANRQNRGIRASRRCRRARRFDCTRVNGIL